MDWRTLLPIALAAMAAASACAFMVYWADKRRAIAGRRRIRERTLHLWELAGGWPGAIVARRALRHKTRDVRFLIVSWAIIAAHAAAWAGAVWLALRPAD